jgi:hypothetical protein
MQSVPQTVLLSEREKTGTAPSVASPSSHPDMSETLTHP